MKRIKSSIVLLALLMTTTFIFGCESGTAEKGLTYKQWGSGYLVSCGRGTEGNVEIPGFYNNKPVIGIDSFGFYYCTKVTSITLPESIVSIGNLAFRNCESLQYLDIPDGITKLDQDLFENCFSLTRVTIPASVKSIWGGVFFGCNNLTDIHYRGSEAVWNAMDKEYAYMPEYATVRFG